MSMIGFPLLLIPLAIYNIIVFLMPGVSFADPVVKLTLMSGAEWPLTLGDMLLALAILLLLSEVIKGARPGAKYLTDHLLSLIVFGGAAAEFVLWPKFGTSTGFSVGRCIACVARNAGDIGPCCGLHQGRASIQPRRDRNAIRSRTCAVGAGSGRGRRIRTAGSPATENPAPRNSKTRGQAKSPAAGDCTCATAGGSKCTIA